MKCKEILEALEEQMPAELAMDWDNVGLLAGRSAKEVKRIVLGLDLSPALLKTAEKEAADLIITHHPLIFTPLRRVTDEDERGRKLLTLLQRDISYIAMHTNYDVVPEGMAEVALRRMGLASESFLEETGLWREQPVGIGKIGLFDRALSLREIAKLVKKNYDLDRVLVYGESKERFLRIAISPGSGKGMYKAALAAGVSVLITGDIGHHEAMDALEAGVHIIDAGHYGIEKIFMEDMERRLLHLDKKFKIYKHVEHERHFV